MSTPTPSLPVVDTVTIFSLLSALSLLIAAYLLSVRLLPASTPVKLRILYIWHLFDCLIHFLFEGSFLYHCFFTYTSTTTSPDYPHPASLSGSRVYFLNDRHRLYGSRYGTSPTAQLWQEYAKADRRWGTADLTIVSLELLTVFAAGPLAAYVCELLRKGGDARRGGGSGKLWFWVTVLATGELYGGFMTFAPEWLSGSTNLDTSNAMYKWVYLFFFNMLWVWFPSWVLYEAYGAIYFAFNRVDGDAARAEMKKQL
ncbi:MAG: hypothetical protein LQ342_002673 [Letrouitia transgressa]|nr:MAG: hypothetical protein LQ342_002673 [Letrouitia transgressa]